MSFQLVRASDDDIAIWQTEHGHIYVFQVTADRLGLAPVLMRDAPDATVPARDFAGAALGFATEEARIRRLITSRAPVGHAPRRSDAVV